jgi:hypothetical protein
MVKHPKKEIVPRKKEAALSLFETPVNKLKSVAHKINRENQSVESELR